MDTNEDIRLPATTEDNAAASPQRGRNSSSDKKRPRRSPKKAKAKLELSDKIAVASAAARLAAAIIEIFLS
jgi:hypothetical protein